MCVGYKCMSCEMVEEGWKWHEMSSLTPADRPCQGIGKKLDECEEVEGAELLCVLAVLDRWIWDLTERLRMSFPLPGHFTLSLPLSSGFLDLDLM